jgi:hypothetical protein
VAFTARVPGASASSTASRTASPSRRSSRAGTSSPCGPTRFEQRKWFECVEGCVPYESSCVWDGLYNTPGRALVQTRAEGADAVSVRVGIEDGALIAQDGLPRRAVRARRPPLPPGARSRPGGHRVLRAEGPDRRRRRSSAVLHDFSGESCPNRTAHTTFCSYDVRGTVTMRKTAEEQRPDPQPTAPAPQPSTPVGPPAPGPLPTATPTPAGSGAPTVRPGASRRATAPTRSRSGASASAAAAR